MHPAQTGMCTKKSKISRIVKKRVLLDTHVKIHIVSIAKATGLTPDEAAVRAHKYFKWFYDCYFLGETDGGDGEGEGRIACDKNSKFRTPPNAIIASWLLIKDEWSTSHFFPSSSRVFCFFCFFFKGRVIVISFWMLVFWYYIVSWSQQMRNIDRYECHPSVYQLFLVIYLYTSLSLSDSLFNSFSAFFFPLFLFLLQGKLIDDYRALQSWYANLLFFYQ